MEVGGARTGARDLLRFLSRLSRLRPRPAHVIVASVRPDLDLAIARGVRAKLCVSARFAARDVAIPLAVRVRAPRRVGVDRLVACVAAAHRLRRGDRGAVVLDCGSAITCDAVTSRGEFLGGAIAPGLGLAARALHEFTAQLPLVGIAGKGRAVRALGRDTEEAIRAGLVIGLRGLASSLAAAARAELGGRAPVFATGGDARLLAPTGAVIAPDLLLRGLALIHSIAQSTSLGARRVR
jgi:type III pantothenate kinase